MPADLQARIASIEARFAPAPTTTSTASANAASSAEFTALLSSMAGDATGTVGGLLGVASDPATSALGLSGLGTGALSTQQNQLIASAMASRNATLGISGVGGVGGVGTSGLGVNATNRIASKAEVAALEKTLDNGRLDTRQLASIGAGSHKLQPAAASAFKQLRAAAAAEGITIGVTDSYRSYDAQVDVARRKGLYSQGGLAAKPGTSDHGLGLAVDLDLDAKALEWMRTNGAKFGFVEDTPRESWHWKFDGV